MAQRGGKCVVSDALQVIFGAVGSGGDINPMLSIAAELQCRGHVCTVLAGSWQEPAARKLGLPFHSILPESNFQQFSAKCVAAESPAESWMAFFYDAVFPSVASTFEQVRRLHVPGRTVLIGASHVIGLRLAAERYGIPIIKTNVQPEPLRPPPEHEYTRYFNALFKRVLDRQRNEYGLPPSNLPFIEWMDTGSDILSLFPPWFLVPGIDAPAAKQGRMLNFIFDDPDVSAQTSREVDAFLAVYEQPIVFTVGTGAHDVREFFEVAEQSAAELSRPAVFLTRARDQISPSLPRGILHVDYLPFKCLLPFAGAIVHHGGIGTSAQALRAGIPQLILPGGFDQFDNAARNRAFGVGGSIEDRCEMTAGLDALLQDRQVAAHCRAYRNRFDPAHTLQWCCDAFEENFASLGLDLTPGAAASSRNS